MIGKSSIAAFLNWWLEAGLDRIVALRAVFHNLRFKMDFSHSAPSIICVCGMNLGYLWVDLSG